MRQLIFASLCACFSLLLGCGEKEPKSYPLSGEVLFDGKPLPYGAVTLTPDVLKGNKGPQGFAFIRQGKYDTTTEDGHGVAGGVTFVHVAGRLTEAGPQICDYEYSVEVPKGGVFNISVPASAAVTVKPPPK